MLFVFTVLAMKINRKHYFQNNLHICSSRQFLFPQRGPGKLKSGMHALSALKTSYYHPCIRSLLGQHIIAKLPFCLTLQRTLPAIKQYTREEPPLIPFLILIFLLYSRKELSTKSNQHTQLANKCMLKTHQTEKFLQTHIEFHYLEYNSESNTLLTTEPQSWKKVQLQEQRQNSSLQRRDQKISRWHRKFEITELA